MSIITNQRLVHLDLKGAPPKPVYLKSLHPLFLKWGVTGLLIEWEDCFPYKNGLETISNKLYSIDDVQQIIQDAHEARLEVIPLVQTFGHLEFVLKHRSFIPYREVPLFPSSLCPSHPLAVKLVTSMLEQVLEFHVGAKFIHIGADEVWHMGLCDKCKSRIEKGETKEDLFLKHVRRVVETIKIKWPNVNIIIWDDMLREMEEATLQTYNLKSLLEPMTWHYNAGDSFTLPPNLLRKYSYFDNVWIAGAFKGATGGSKLLPVISHHASNVLQWTCLVNQLKTNYRGFVFTGWSRYDHFAALCELLPTSLPSLGVCLLTLEEKSYTPATVARIEADLGYSIEVSNLERSTSLASNVNNHGWGILTGVLKFVNLRQAANQALNSEQLETWMNEWQVARGLVNPMQLVSLVPVLNNFLAEVEDIEKSLRNHMSFIYYDATVTEWLGTYLIPLRNRLQNVAQTSEEEITKASKFVDEALKMSRKSAMPVEMDC